jgi:hypothetical protein
MPTALFDADVVPSLAELRAEEQYGYWDARARLPRRSDYSRQLTGNRLVAYDRGYTAGLAEVK